jgi:putative heme iron utilization protein
MWEHTANGGAGENWSLMVPSDDVRRRAICVVDDLD